MDNVITQDFIICSQGIKSLLSSLVVAKKKFKPAIKGTTNPFYKSKYADLATLIEATEDALLENGLLILQWPGYNATEKTAVITTMLAHTSGEYLIGVCQVPLGSKIDAQAHGSAITYGRRYGRQSILDMAAEDDDGAAASGTTVAKSTPPPKAIPTPSEQTMTEFIESASIPANPEDRMPTPEEYKNFVAQIKTYKNKLAPEAGIDSEKVSEFLHNQTGVDKPKNVSYGKWMHILAVLDLAVKNGNLKILLEGTN